jgi:hypothetical protein
MSSWLKHVKSVPTDVQRRDRRNIWYKIDSASLNRPMRRDQHVYFEFSPYDVPEAVSGELDEKHGVARIFFKYINDEPTSRVDMSDFVVYLGKHSHRLHEVEMQAKTIYQKGIVSAISQAIEQLNRNRPTETPPDRYNIAREVVSDVGDRLLERVA